MKNKEKSIYTVWQKYADNFSLEKMWERRKTVKHLRQISG